MNDAPKLNWWQWARTRAHLYLVGVRKRLTVGVRTVLIDRASRVLLVRHTYLPGWHFPGGGVEPFETAELAAAREAMEETGYGVHGRPQLLGFYLNRIAGGGRDHVAVYIWREFTTQLEFAPNLEIAECKWFELGALPADIDSGTRQRIREIFDDAPPAAEWTSDRPARPRAR
jgi:8-oxo-dGTP pyrophosphatase MutT (NUDIX family)